MAQKALGVNLAGAARGADLGGSSKYSREALVGLPVGMAEPLGEVSPVSRLPWIAIALQVRATVA